MDQPQELITNSQSPETPIIQPNRRLVPLLAVVCLGLLVVTVSGLIMLKFKTQSVNPNTSNINELVPDSLPVEEEDTQIFALMRQDNVWVSVGGDESQITTDAVPTEIPFWTGLPKLWYSDPQISPDGKKIAFLKNSTTTQRSLMVVDVNGGTPKELTSDVAWTMPLISWSADSQLLYYASDSKAEAMLVKSSTLTNLQVQEYGEFLMKTGCGGGSSDPSDHVSAQEHISSVGGGVQTFQLLPNNKILHSTNCGGIGLALFDLASGKDKEVDFQTTKASISDDGTQFAALTKNSVVIYNSEGQRINSYTTQEDPQSLYWDPNGEDLYYTTSTLRKELKPSDTVAEKFWGTTGIIYKINDSQLWSLNLDSGESTTLAKFNAHYIKPLVRNGDILKIVAVENADYLYQFITTSSERDKLVDNYPQVNLIEFNLTDMTTTLFKKNLSQVDRHTDSY